MINENYCRYCKKPFKGLLPSCDCSKFDTSKKLWSRTVKSKKLVKKDLSGFLKTKMALMLKAMKINKEYNRREIFILIKECTNLQKNILSTLNFIVSAGDVVKTSYNKYVRVK